MKRLLFTLSLIMFVSSQCFANVTIIDVFNLTGIGGPLNPLNTNSGGGNQHQQSSSPIFSFTDMPNMPRVIFQRDHMDPKGSSSLVIYKGLVTPNQKPPPGSPTLINSIAPGSLSTIPDYTIDYATYNVANSPGQQVWNFMSADPTGNYTIAVVELSNNKTVASFQFNFNNLINVNGVPTPNIYITTQLGSTGQ